MITDHCSSDQTTEILRHFQRQGIVSFDRNEESAFQQDVWVMEMAQRAAKEFGADWVINSATDEFWWPEEGGSLKNVLSLVHQPPNVMHRGFEDILVAFGNHSAKRAQSSVTSGVAPITCFHFPVRSRKQLRKKVRDGSSAVALNPDIGEGIAVTWRVENQLIGNDTFNEWFDDVHDQNLRRISDSNDVILDVRLREKLANLR